MSDSRKIWYGGDYNPEQWPPAVWDADHAAFDMAHIDTLTVNVFAWAILEPREGSDDLTGLDRIVDRIEAEGRHIVLATSTGAMPPWLPVAHPDVLRTDFDGRRHVYGQRHNACPNSPSFRRASAALAEQLARRYAGRESLIAWHIGNEYGGACYCTVCAEAFRVWLRRRYGDLATLNSAWNTTFWSHTYTNFDQIMPPNALSEHWRGEDHTAFQGVSLDYRRFMTDSMLDQFLNEKQALRRHDPTTPVTTNFMGLYRPIDYFRWSKHLDFASWDNYPPDMNSHVRMAMTHDLNRGLVDGKPFWVMEQTPSRTASRDVNPLKRPGVMGLWSWQAVAHGADAVLFFQMRASVGACEKYHGAVIDHSGRTDTRTFREVATLGEQLARLGQRTIGATTPSRVGLIWDWDSWWAWEMTDGINRHLKYMDVALSYYRSFHELGVDIDVVPMDADFGAYDVVLAPLMHMVKGDVVERLETVARRGGTVITGFGSARVDESDNAICCRSGSGLADLAGIRLEEIDAAEPGIGVGVEILGTSGATKDPSGTADPETRDEHGAGHELESGNGRDAGIAEGECGRRSPGSVTQGHGRLVMEVVTAVTAEVRATYQEQYYAGTPAVTQNRVGSGDVIYIATLLDDTSMRAIVRPIADRLELTGPFADHPGIEVTRRVRSTARGTAQGGAMPQDGATSVDTMSGAGTALVGTASETVDEITFVLNHGDATTVAAPWNCRDLLSGQTWRSGETVELGRTCVRLLVRD
ncbi:MAG: beta-galactosidase [Propionibacteriaceae bacterium]|nr:beta-galactosidase [Propionibacteriaceae bacterium]